MKKGRLDAAGSIEQPRLLRPENPLGRELQLARKQVLASDVSRCSGSVYTEDTGPPNGCCP